MPEFRPSIDAPPGDEAAHCHGSRERFLLGLLLLALVRSSEASAVDQMTVVSARINPAPVNFGSLSPTVALVTPWPGIFTIPTSGGVPLFSTTEFCPRKHTLFDHDLSASAVSETPLIHYTTVWQRLSEYKSQHRVQVLTLWESSGSSVSIQAGKRGAPSLQ